jgi:hypothetical protein
LPNSIDVQGDLLERLLIIQSLLEQDRRIKNIERRVNMIIKEISILDETFEEGRKERVLLSLESESRITTTNTNYLQKLLKKLEDLKEIRENR